MTVNVLRRITAEVIGTSLLLATVVGSGIMAERLTDIPALALLANASATAAALVVLVTVFGPISGAHFNPVVTLAAWLQREVQPAAALLYVAAQVVGALIGTAAAHLMFDLPVAQLSLHVRRRTMARGSNRDSGSAASDRHSWEAPALDGASPCRALHRCRLLVHVVDVIRQPGSDLGAGLHQHLLGHRSG